MSRVYIVPCGRTELNGKGAGFQCSHDWYCSACQEVRRLRAVRRAPKHLLIFLDKLERQMMPADADLVRAIKGLLQ